MKIRGYRRCKHGATKPHRISLHVMTDHVYFDRRRGGHDIGQTAEARDVQLHSEIDMSLDVSLQSSAEILEHSTASGEHDVLVESSPHINGALYNRFVDYRRERSGEVGTEDLGVEEHLGA